jgi:hypothetical protein
MSKPKSTRQGKSVQQPPEREPLIVEVQFTGPATAPPTFPGANSVTTPAKKSDRPPRPSLFFKI